MSDFTRRYAKQLRWSDLRRIRQAIDSQRRSLARETRPEHVAQTKRMLDASLVEYREQLALMKRMAASDRLAKAQTEGLMHLSGQLWGEAAE